MKQTLEETSSNFNAHLHEIAAEYNRLLERCRILERNMNQSVDSMLYANDGMEAPPLEDVPDMSAASEASAKVFGSRGQEDAASPHMQRHSALSQRADVVPLDSFISQGEGRNEPEVQVQLRHCWSETSDVSAELETPCNSANRVTEQAFIAEMEQQKQEHICLASAVDPNSGARLIFECVTICVCLYDAVVVPYELAWQPPRTVAFTVLAVLTVTFWWSEMGLNFFTGYMDQGVLVTDIKQTAWNYLSSWFILDFAINVVDLAILVIDVALSSTQGSSPAFLKYLRIGKLNRLARIMFVLNRNRLQQVMRALSIESSNFTLLGLGVRLIAILLLLNHVICCAWYGIGSLSGDTGKSWLDMNITSGGIQYRSAPREFQYLTALHWAFTQMTPGSMSVVPQNSIERAWNVLCLILGLFVSSLLISQLSAKMVRVQTVNGTQLQQMERLGRFLLEHDVPRSLAQRIRRQVSERVTQTKMLTMEDLPSLADLPTSLKQELDAAIFARSMLNHSVLYSWCLVHDGASKAICYHVAEEEAYTKNDEIFLPGQAASKAYFLQQGSMSYRREVPLPAGGSMLIGQRSGIDFPDVSVARTDWMSTIAMWCHWNYVGRLNACEACNTVNFNMEKMIELLKGYPSISASSRSYASAYVLMATSSEHAIKADLDISPSRVLMAMPLDERVTFSARLVDSFQARAGRLSLEKYYPTRRQRVSPQVQLRLLEELETGRCVVTLGRDQQLLRTVGICVLDLVDSDGRVLVEIATKEQGEDAVLKIALPATKMRERESNRKAAMRLIRTDLPEMEGTLNFGEVLNEEYETDSKQLGIRTTYMKTTYNASLWPQLFQDLRSTGFVEKLHVSNPPVDWTQTQSITDSSRSMILGLKRIVSSSGTATRSSHMAETGSKASDSVVAGVTIIPVKCEDKAKFYAWLSRDEFHEVKQAMLNNESPSQGTAMELMAKVMEAFSEVEKGHRHGVSEEEDEASEGMVEV